MMPSYLGRLPALISEPAGGSLTADQWLVMATVVAPIAVSLFELLLSHASWLIFCL
jgi:hypothetical protein